MVKQRASQRRRQFRRTDLLRDVMHQRTAVNALGVARERVDALARQDIKIDVLDGLTLTNVRIVSGIIEVPSAEGEVIGVGSGASTHNELTGVTTDQHHPQTHSILSHDTTATGAELTELTDGSTTSLHAHPGGGVTFGVPTGNIDIGDAAVEGVSSDATRADHQHLFTAPSAGYPIDIAATEDDGVLTTPARADHRHAHPSGLGATLHHDNSDDHSNALDHFQSHVIATTAGLGSDHTTSGLTAGQVLRASGASAAAFAALAHGDLSDAPPTAHHDNSDDHVEVHVVGSSGPHAQSGLTIGHVLRVSGAAAFDFAALVDGDIPTTHSGSAHHTQNHASRHSDAGADELTVEDLATGSVDVSAALRPDGTGGLAFSDLAHGDLSDAPTDAHHVEVHIVASTGPHAQSGLTIGHVLRASTTSAFDFAAIADGDIPSTHAGSAHHTRSHTMPSTSDHSATNWRIFYSNGSGNVIELGFGAAGTHLESAGVSAAPVWGAAGSVSFGVPTGNIDIGDAAVEGVSGDATRADHQHLFTAPGAGYPVDVAATEADGAATTPARSDHRHAHGSGYLPTAHHDNSDDHVEVHTVASTGPHAQSGLTIGHVLRASSTSAFDFAALQDGDIPSTHAGSAHHTAAHDIVTHDTTATGAELTELTDGSTTTLHDHAAGPPASHVLATTAGLGAEHTTSGLTAGMVLRAATATTALFVALAHGDLSDAPPTAHHDNSDDHVEIHTVASTGPHAQSGLTIGHVLRASSTTAFDFAALLDGDIPSTHAGSAHHAQLHASAHQPGGGDTMAVDAVAGTGSLRTLGGGAQQAAAGNHTILSHDTTGTGAELTELTDGSLTTLHAHAGGLTAPGVTLTAAMSADLTLTSASDRIQRFVPTASWLVVNMPDATTLTEGDQYRLFNEADPNNRHFGVLVKDDAGDVIRCIMPSQVMNLILLDDATAAGVWSLVENEIARAANENPNIAQYLPALVPGQISTSTARALTTGNPASAIARLSDTLFVVSFMDTSNFETYVMAGTVAATGVITLGTPVILGFSSSAIGVVPWSIVRLDATTFIAAYQVNGPSVNAKVGTVSGTTITVGTQQSHTSGQSWNWISLALLDTDKVIACYALSTADDVKAQIWTRSGDSITFETEFNVFTGTSTLAHAKTNLVVLSTTRALLGHNSGGAGGTWVEVLGISGTTITSPGTKLALGGAANNFANIHIAIRDATHFLIAWSITSVSHLRIDTCTITSDSPAFDGNEFVIGSRSAPSGGSFSAVFWRDPSDTSVSYWIQNDSRLGFKSELMKLTQVGGTMAMTDLGPAPTRNDGPTQPLEKYANNYVLSGIASNQSGFNAIEGLDGNILLGFIRHAGPTQNGSNFIDDPGMIAFKFK